MEASPFRVERTADGVRFSFDLVAERTVRQQKRARFGPFEMQSDEGANLGGDDSAPPPLAYFAAALGF
jgi:uncharacterized OsmC-like protein